jgi:hypothetical protein
MIKLNPIILAISVLILGCVDEAEVQRGNIVGKIGYYEKEYINYIDSLEGADIILTNGESVFEVKSAVNGLFIFENIPAGNYKLSIAKENYAYYTYGEFVTEPLQKQIIHVGGGVTNAGSAQFYEIPEYTTVFENYEWISDTVLVIHLKIPPTVQDYYPFNIYISEDASVSETNFEFLWHSGMSFNYFDEPMVIDTLTGDISLKLPFLRSSINHYFAVSSSSIWAYELAGPSSNALLITP